LVSRNLIPIIDKEDTNVTYSNKEKPHVGHNRKKSSFQTDETEKASSPENIPKAAYHVYQKSANDHSHRVSMMDSEIFG